MRKILAGKMHLQIKIDGLAFSPVFFVLLLGLQLFVCGQVYDPIMEIKMTPVMKLVCGAYEVETNTPLKFCPTHIGCSFVNGGRDDLFDLGFKHSELLKHGLKVYVDNHLIVDFPAE